MGSTDRRTDAPGVRPPAAGAPPATMDYAPDTDAHALDKTPKLTALGFTSDFNVNAPTHALDAARVNPGLIELTSVGAEFGNYELQSEIARGGMGVVYKARQKSLNRIVAVKMIIAGQMASPTAVQRFYAEAQAAANLRHPGIVGIYEVGEFNGHHFFSMEFIEGESLADKIRDKPLLPADAARYLVQIAEAIAYAHDHGILHRDLKPSNVLIDQSDRARVTDFGLAKQLENATQLTGADALLGTPSYMPPEQAAAKHGDVNRTSDVYALGAVLYELLTGRPPFIAAQPIEIIFQVLRTDPVAPRLLNPNVPVDLETIALKCLTKEQSKRYPTAGELAADVRRWMDGEPILARPTGQAERLARWCKRNPRVAFLAGTTLFLLVAVAAVSTSAAILIRSARDRALQNLVAEEAAKKTAEQNAKIARRVVENLVGSFTDTMTDVGALSEVQRRILEDARSVFEDFLRVEQTDPRLKIEAAIAQRKLGDIARLQGRAEDVAVAASSYADSIRRFQELVDADPTNPTLQRELAESWNWQGELLRPTERRLEAERAYRTALELQDRLASNFPELTAVRGDAGRSHYNLGILHRDSGNFPAAKSDFDAAIAIYKKLVAEAPDRPEFQHGLARSFDNLGTLHNLMRDPTQAEADYRNAIAAFQSLMIREPRRPDYRHELAGSLMNLSNLAGQNVKKLDEAEAVCRQAKTVYEALAKEFRVRTIYRRDLAKSWMSLGQIEWKRNRRDAARDCWLAAIGGLRDLVDEQPNVFENQSLLAGCLDNMAYWHAKSTQPEVRNKANEYLSEAGQRLRQVLNGNIRDSWTRNQLLSHGQIASMAGDPHAAVRSVEPLLDPPLATPPELESMAKLLAKSFNAIARSSSVLAKDSLDETAIVKLLERTLRQLATLDPQRLHLLNGPDFSSLRTRAELADFVGKIGAAGRH